MGLLAIHFLKTGPRVDYCSIGEKQRGKTIQKVRKLEGVVGHG